jgi:DNA-binding CsgD family transcriptional regulator
MGFRSPVTALLTWAVTALRSYSVSLAILLSFNQPHRPDAGDTHRARFAKSGWHRLTSLWPELSNIFVTTVTHNSSGATMKEHFQMANALITSREWEVANLVSTGLSSKQIAHHLSILEGTVRNHLYHIFQKVGVKNRTALTAIILRPAEGTAPIRRRAQRQGAVASNAAPTRQGAVAKPLYSGALAARRSR